MQSGITICGVLQELERKRRNGTKCFMEILDLEWILQLLSLPPSRFDILRFSPVVGRAFGQNTFKHSDRSTPQEKLYISKIKQYRSVLDKLLSSFRGVEPFGNYTAVRKMALYIIVQRCFHPLFCLIPSFCALLNRLDFS